MAAACAVATAAGKVYLAAGSRRANGAAATRAVRLDRVFLQRRNRADWRKEFPARIYRLAGVIRSKTKRMKAARTFIPSNFRNTTNPLPAKRRFRSAAFMPLPRGFANSR